jgi:2-polyprenyl-6-hydroxyphenyl methylase/3-demethylubiquinone-9 3-methyltransferase
MSQLNVDPQEIAKFEALAAKWWDQHSEFRPLHQINPLRLNWIDERVGGLQVKKCLMSAVVAVFWQKAWHVVAQMFWD